MGILEIKNYTNKLEIFGQSNSTLKMAEKKSQLTKRKRLKKINVVLETSETNPSEII